VPSLRPAMKRSRLRRLALLAVMAGAAVWIALIAAIDAYGQVDRARPADAIVVLGAQVHAGGRSGPAIDRRVRHAAALYQRGLSDRIICSGGLGDQPPAEAEVMCALLADLGVPEAALLREDQSHSTEDNAANTAALMRERGWRSAIVVTDDFHLLRAAAMFQRAGIEVYSSPAQTTAGPLPPLERIGREAREALGLAWFGLRVLLRIDGTAH